MVDVFFVNPPATGNFLRELNRCSKKNVFGEVWPQTALAYLYSVITRGGFSADIVDCIAEGISTERLVKLIGANSPRFVVLLVSTTTFYNDSSVATRVKAETDCKVCAIGVHVSALPREALLHGFDFVIRGEAELALLNLVSGKPAEAIRGLYFLKNRKTVGRGVGMLIRDLDELSAPDRSRLPNSKYHMPIFKGNFATVIPSRGCPFHCSFCRTKVFYGDSFRVRTPQNVADEVNELYAGGTRNFFFQADTFTANRKWILKFCSILKRSGLDITWASNSRVDCFFTDVAAAMASAGCKFVTFGVESGSQLILDRLNKGITLAQSSRAIKNAGSAGLISAAHFIFGTPDESAYTASATAKFSRKLKPHFAIFNIATPYPGTGLRSVMSRERCILTDDWSLYDNFHSAVVRTKHLDARSIAQIRKKAEMYFYLDPNYPSSWAASFSVERAELLLRVFAGFVLSGV